MLRVDWHDPRTKRLCLSYLKDWVLVIVMMIVFFALDTIPPFRREFSLTDKSIMFPFQKETVPVWLLLVLCLVVPILIITTVSLAVRRSLHDLHSGLLGLLLALSLTIMATEVIKITVGRPRPDMLDRCKPQSNATDPMLGLTAYSVCTTPINSPIMIDAFKSFPSGHSSFSFAGLGFIAFFLAGKMSLFDERGHTYKCFVFAAPLVAALMVAISRTRDYRHHWQDVVIGSILGILFAYFSYRQYYPSLACDNCQNPYKLRIGRTIFDVERVPDRQSSGEGDAESIFVDQSYSRARKDRNSDTTIASRPQGTSV